jgi:peptidylglycine monooxygenase
MRSVAVDSRGRVYVGHRPLLYGNLPPVAVFDPDGTYLGGWGRGVFQGIHNLHITPADEIYVVDQDLHRIFKFAPDGTLKLTLGTGLPRLNAPFNNPTGIAVAPDGTLFISDGDSNTLIHAFTATGAHLRSWGTPGKGPGQITSPHSIAVDAAGLVYVGDRDASRVVVFSPTGEHLREWTDVLHRPTSLWIGRDGLLYVADLVVRVHLYDLHGQVRGRAHAALPVHSITGDRQGNLYLVGDLPNVEKWELLDAAAAAALVPAASFDLAGWSQ